MAINPTSLAAGNFVGVKNVQFQPIAEVLARKILIIGTKDPLKTALAADTPVQVLSPEDVADKAGFGSQLHRLAIWAFEGGQGIETWMIPQDEAGGAVAAAGELDFTGSTGVLAGTLYLYIAGQAVPVAITAAMTVENIADAVVAAITADTSLPVTAAKVAVTFEVTITAKMKGTYGNDISLTFNWGAGEELPTGIVVATTAMTGGATDPDISDALNALGTGDDSNEDFFTDVVHGYGDVTATLDAMSTYNGPGNDFLGNYAKEVARPFRSMNGDTAAGSGGLTALLALGDGRKIDRTNGTVGVPGSPNHPQEIAALAVGIAANVNNNRAEEPTIEKLMPGIIPGARADRWTSDYDNRDLAVKSGISTTTIKNGAVYIGNLVTYYHPDNVPQSSNGYRSYRNVSILQNILNSSKLNFAQEKWQGISIVGDVTNVGNVNDRQKARDVESVKDDLVALALSFQNNAWIYNAAFTIEQLKDAGSVTVRTLTNGFDTIFKIILSGEGGILNSEIQFDTSIAVLL